MILWRNIPVSNMIDNLLDLNRLQSGQLKIQMETADLAGVVQRVVDPFYLTASKHTIDVELPLDPVILTADPLWIEQVLQNLISNAIKYSSAGGAITVELEHRTDQICLVVSDQGIGIPAEDQAQLFVPFYRASHVHRPKLIGLGLGCISFMRS